jgi:hypothetical protein
MLWIIILILVVPWALGFFVEGQLQYPTDGQPRPYAVGHRCNSDHLAASRCNLARAGFRDRVRRTAMSSTCRPSASAAVVQRVGPSLDFLRPDAGGAGNHV